MDAKRRELEDQQLHLNIGLDKLEDTQREVTELNRGLAAKERELVAKNKEANEKLERMLVDQSDAEQKRAVRAAPFPTNLTTPYLCCLGMPHLPPMLYAHVPPPPLWSGERQAGC